MGLRPFPHAGAVPAEIGTAPPRVAGPTVSATPRSQVKSAEFIYDQILARVEPALAVRMARPELTIRVEELVAEIADQRRLLLNHQEQQSLAAAMVDDMIALGPLESLLSDDSVSDILVNGPRQIYIERSGKLVLTGVRFRNDLHVLHVAQRIASSIGRRQAAFTCSTRPPIPRPASGSTARLTTRR